MRLFCFYLSFVVKKVEERSLASESGCERVTFVPWQMGEYQFSPFASKLKTQLLFMTVSSLNFLFNLIAVVFKLNAVAPKGTAFLLQPSANSENQSPRSRSIPLSLSLSHLLSCRTSFEPNTSGYFCNAIVLTKILLHTKL